MRAGQSEKIQCQICGEEFHVITQSHLNPHNILVTEYRLQFPEAPLVSSSYRERMRRQGYLRFPIPSVIVSDGEGNFIRLKVVDRQPERPTAIWNSGTIGDGGTILPCQDDDDLQKLIQRAFPKFSFASMQIQRIER